MRRSWHLEAQRGDSSDKGQPQGQQLALAHARGKIQGNAVIPELVRFLRSPAVTMRRRARPFMTLAQLADVPAKLQDQPLEAIVIAKTRRWRHLPRQLTAW
jgi:hypothetical protein